MTERASSAYPENNSSYKAVSTPPTGAFNLDPSSGYLQGDYGSCVGPYYGGGGTYVGHQKRFLTNGGEVRGESLALDIGSKQQLRRYYLKPGNIKSWKLLGVVSQARYGSYPGGAAAWSDLHEEIDRRNNVALPSDFWFTPGVGSTGGSGATGQPFTSPSVNSYNVFVIVITAVINGGLYGFPSIGKAMFETIGPPQQGPAALPRFNNLAGTWRAASTFRGMGGLYLTWVDANTLRGKMGAGFGGMDVTLTRIDYVSA